MPRRCWPALARCWRTPVLVATLLAVACAGSNDSGNAQLVGKADNISLLINRVWTVTQSTSVAPGTLYVFLAEGTLIIASSTGTPLVGSWKFESQTLTMVEEGIAYRVEILAISETELRLRSHNPGQRVDITLVPAAPRSARSRREWPGSVRFSWCAPQPGCVAVLGWHGDSRQGHREHGSASGTVTVGLDLASVQGDDVADNGQSDAQPGILGRPDLLKELENSRQLRRFEPPPRVFDAQHGIAARALGRDLDATARLGVLDGVVDQIGENLAKTIGIGVNP